MNESELAASAKAGEALLTSYTIPQLTGLAPPILTVEFAFMKYSRTNPDLITLSINGAFCVGTNME